jgi:antitoxin component YwqK of YwqJK toxin-antitoxin module
MAADQENQADNPLPDAPEEAAGGADANMAAPKLPDFESPLAAADEKTAAPGLGAQKQSMEAGAASDAAGVPADGVEGDPDATVAQSPEKRVSEDEAGTRSEATFLNGELNGESRIYNPQGDLIQKSVFAKGVLNGPLFTYDGKGQITQKANYVNGKLNGKMTIYENERIRSEFNYRDGLLQGKARHYSENKQLIGVENYSEGAYEGVNRWYDNQGNLLVKAPYKAGLLQGMRVEYYITGDTRERAPYKNNLLEGEVRRYYKDGALMQKVLYREGRQVGALIEYDEAGNVRKDSWWVRFARWIQGKKKVEVDTAEGGGGLRG